MSKRTTAERAGEALSFAMKLRNRGYSLDQIRRALLDHDVVRALHEQAGINRADRFARRTAERAVQLVTESPADRSPVQIVARVAEIRESADSVPWPGRTGSTDRRVLEGAYLTASICRSTTFNCSIRTWAARCGIGRQACTDAVKRLRDRGAVELVVRGGDQRAAKYRLARMSRTRTSPSVIPSVRVGDIGPDHLPAPEEHIWLAHDAFRREALGDAGWQITRWLHPADPVRAWELAQVTGMERRRVYAVLGKLAVAEIALKDPSGWRRVASGQLPRDLDAVAIAAGTAGSLEADRAQYEAERQRFRLDRLLTVRVDDLVEAG